MDRVDPYVAYASARRQARPHAWQQANWRLYAAVTGSALATLSGASAAVIQSEPGAGSAEPAGSARLLDEHLANSRNVPLLNAVKLALNAGGPRPAVSPGPPTITPGGIVPLYGKTNLIQPGEWISIYGTNLASVTAMWNNDFPVSLGGTSVTINNKPAYLLFVSPGQINLQAPDDTARGTVSVVVKTSAGSVASTVNLSESAPSFSVLDGKHVSGIIFAE